MHAEPGDRVEPDRRDRDRGVHTGLLQVPHVEREATHRRGRERARERGGDLREERRDDAEPVGDRAGDAERRAHVGEQRRRDDRHEPDPVGRFDLVDDARQVGQLRQQEVRDQDEHHDGEDRLAVDARERHELGLVDARALGDGPLELP